MSKTYVKDSNGKYRLVDKPETQQTTLEGAQSGTPEQRAWIREIMEGPKLRELDARIKRLESIVIDPRKK